jgi:hypothetical protein
MLAQRTWRNSRSWVYPREMPGKPPEPPAADRSGGDATPVASGEQTEPERLGPLTVSRHLKDDGRALILFSRSEPEQQ